jgi:adenylosuccinate synthase
MPATVVLGTQWGDEGKGKAVDYLADRMDFVVRYQGGNNAGHTIIAEGRLLKLNLVPSGVLYPHITNVIGDGVVVDPAVLLRGEFNLPYQFRQLHIHNARFTPIPMAVVPISGGG